MEWTGTNLNLSELERRGYKPVVLEARHGTHGICILTKDIEATQANVLQSPVDGPCRMPIGVLRFLKKSTSVTIFGVHAPPPVSACEQTTAPTLRAISSWIRNGRVRQDIGVARQGDLAIVAGDLNTLPFYPAVTVFKESGLQDAYAKTHWRLGPTWSPFV